MESVRYNAPVSKVGLTQCCAPIRCLPKLNSLDTAAWVGMVRYIDSDLPIRKIPSLQRTVTCRRHIGGAFKVTLKMGLVGKTTAKTNVGNGRIGIV